MAWRKEKKKKKLEECTDFCCACASSAQIIAFTRSHCGAWENQTDNQPPHFDTGRARKGGHLRSRLRGQHVAWSSTCGSLGSPISRGRGTESERVSVGREMCGISDTVSSFNDPLCVLVETRRRLSVCSIWCRVESLSSDLCQIRCGI